MKIDIYSPTQLLTGIINFRTPGAMFIRDPLVHNLI